MDYKPLICSFLNFYDNYFILERNFFIISIGLTCSLVAISISKDAPAEDDDDDIDLFGDETEEEKKAAEEREAAKKQSSKKKESMHAWIRSFIYIKLHVNHMKFF